MPLVSSPCSNTPATAERIECTDETTSTSAIDIDVSNFTISTTAIGESDIRATHNGSGNFNIDTISSTINVRNVGITVTREGNRSIELDSRSDVITTMEELITHRICAEKARQNNSRYHKSLN